MSISYNISEINSNFSRKVQFFLNAMNLMSPLRVFSGNFLILFGSKTTIMEVSVDKIKFDDRTTASIQYLYSADEQTNKMV